MSTPPVASPFVPPGLPRPRALPLRSALTIVTTVAAIGFLLLGLRGLIDPAGGAHSLGVTVRDPADLALMQAVGARNIGMALLGLALVWADARRALGLLLAAAALIAALDAVVILQASGPATAAKHLAYLAVLAGLALAVLRPGRRA